MKKLIKMLIEDNSFAVESTDALKEQIEAEMKKESPDIDLINELVLTISEDENYPPTDLNIETEYKKIIDKGRRKPGFSYIKAFFTAACAIIVLSNIISYSAYGENLYTIVTKNEDKIHFNFLKSDQKEKSVFEYDEYGVKKFYENIGMKVESPMYFPKGFEIIEKRLDENLVTLSNGIGQVDISFMNLSRGLTIAGINPNESVIHVNGHIATYINDENADWLIYKFDDIVAIYDFQYINDEEIQKIIESIE